MSSITRASQFLFATLREPPTDAVAASHRLLVQAGCIRQLGAGLYDLLPLGLRSLRKLERILHEEMVRVGAQEFCVPSLHPAELWRSSGRWSDIDATMFRLQDRRGKDMCLAMTHEEVFTAIAARELHSYRQLPQLWYQIGRKFRDEPRPRSGLLRVREFHMKDAYSFDIDAEALDRTFETLKAAYHRIFERVGVPVVATPADAGDIGGEESIEFLTPVSAGEDALLEVGHIFKLATRYSAPLNASVLTADGTRVPIQMGCYGIGLERLLAAIVEVHHDDHGIIWPLCVAPFSATVLALSADAAAVAERVASHLASAGLDVLYDDRPERAGVKLNDADLTGIPLRVTVGASGADDTVEVKLRSQSDAQRVRLSEVEARAASLLHAPAE
jgi:prolyl-tRNA synthetase